MDVSSKGSSSAYCKAAFARGGQIETVRPHILEQNSEWTTYQNDVIPGEIAEQSWEATILEALKENWIRFPHRCRANQLADWLG
jgi:ferredoxin